MRLLITGGSSYLGRHLLPLAERLPAAEVLSTHYAHAGHASGASRRLDVRDKRAVDALVSAFAPDVIIHLAGSNRPAETMERVIRQGATNIVAAARSVAARLLFLSTDVVFDGRDAPYDEAHPPTPLHAYGRAKAAAEAEVAAYENHVIVRTSLIYGLQQMDRGTAWMVRALRAGEPLTLFVNQFRNPVWAPSLSRASLELVRHGFTGIIHIAGAQRLSRAAFGQRMLAWWGIDPGDRLALTRCDPERWPLDCTLDIGLAQDLLATPLLGVDEVLHRERPSAA